MGKFQELNIKDIDKIRQSGLRPQVVGCFVSQNKVLMLYKDKHNLWQFPQGGVDNDESLEQALLREMKEELGFDFCENAKTPYIYLGEDKIMFPPKIQGSRELKNDKGENIYMKGKKYFLFAIETSASSLDIKQTEFDDYQWCDYLQAKELTNQIHQKGKKRLTNKILELLKENNNIS